MKYQLAIGFVAIIFLIALYDHLITGFVYFTESNYLLATYNWLVCLVLFLFAAGYVSKLEIGLKNYKISQAENERKKREQDAHEFLRKTLDKTKSS